jgi:hypothetical protein
MLLVTLPAVAKARHNTLPWLLTRHKSTHRPTTVYPVSCLLTALIPGGVFLGFVLPSLST